MNFFIYYILLERERNMHMHAHTHTQTFTHTLAHTQMTTTKQRTQGHLSLKLDKLQFEHVDPPFIKPFLAGFAGDLLQS